MKAQSIIFAKEFADLVREKLGSHILDVKLFGSHARGDAWIGSDFDVLVIVDERTPEIRERVLDVSVYMMTEHETLFAPVIYNLREWEKTSKYPFAWNIQKEGINV